jgi:poly [ADP-ribose] polymerase
MATKTSSKTKVAAAAAGGSTAEVDSSCPIKASAAVHDVYNAMLNQTNIGANNNKFYVIQVLAKGGKYFVWNRWGRVGETGQSALKGPLALPGALSEFERKFKDKTGNAWAKRAAFKAVSGRYTLIEIEAATDKKRQEIVVEKLKALDKARPAAKPAGVLPCTLPGPTQSLIKLIFDHDMFKSAMESFEIDTNKMPLGQLSKAQVAKGFEALEDIDAAIRGKKTAKLPELTSRFYTLIPHSFGRRKPPVIASEDELQKKKDMLNVLSDIEVALGMESKAAKTETKGKKPHPLDEHYAKLDADLAPVAKGSKEFEVIAEYLQRTASGHRKPTVMDVFQVNRRSEVKRFAAHDDLENRKLLWHGTNVAVVAAILGGGLRIMPHSGGRVGRGIYLASENGKSAQYVGTARGVGIMFLAEAALGKEHHIARDNSRLREAPKGFHSIVARGRTEPDPKSDIVMKFDGRKVTVPQGKPVAQSKWSKSSFSQSEYLLYKESQVRLRYVLMLKM